MTYAVYQSSSLARTIPTGDTERNILALPIENENTTLPGVYGPKVNRGEANKQGQSKLQQRIIADGLCEKDAEANPDRKYERDREPGCADGPWQQATSLVL
jgi:hypothetical protein